jgi:hypothetical protein
MEQILGSEKTVRAIAENLVYRGRAIRGRRRTKVDGKFGAFDIVETPGETFTCDADFAREAINTGKVEYLSGGLCSVLAEKDGFHRYVPWNSQSEHVPQYERCETLHTIAWAGLFFPAGYSLRIDINQFDRPYYCFEDETAGVARQLRVLKLSPKKVKLDAAEQAGMVAKLMAAVFPAAA